MVKVFNSLKKQLEVVTLHNIDEILPFVMECDVIFATLNQAGRPVAFMS